MATSAVNPPAPNWSAVLEEASAHLANLIRLDTSNPPGNEISAARYLRDALGREGLDSRILEMAPGRANLVARLPGDGSRGPLLLFGHTDVVPADADGWKHPPFSGAIAEEHIWGRGAVDMKHIVASMLTVVLLAKRFGLRLKRDLVFAATADEESTGESGAGWLFRVHPELVACDIAVTEAGSTVTFNGKDYFLVELGQKGWLTIDLVRRSRSAHSSIPTRDNCLYDTGAILNQLATKRFPHRVIPLARSFFTHLAEDQSEAQRDWLMALLDPARFDGALQRLDCDEQTKGLFEALLHSQATPTIARGGESTWSVPESATIRLAGRVLPGETEDQWLTGLAEAIGPLGEHTVSAFDPGVESTSNGAFERSAEIIRRHHSGARVLPTLSPGGGDSRHPLMAGAACLSIFHLAPERGTPVGFELAHARNERISLPNLLRCVAAAWDVVCLENDIPLAPPPQ
jgi:acetylornithine deacetylase/succinyl-diaminopimelate desuccinylase-like protein